MSLSWTGFTMDDFIDEFEESTAVSRREAKKVLRAGAKQIMETGKAMAPVDEGNLENAFHVAEVRSNVDEITLTIDVGGIVGDRDVSDYAAYVHEAVLPYGSGPDTIGLKSQEKDAVSPYRVGGKFLERALDVHEQEIIDKIANTLPGDE